jgi:hypothetical protein
MIWYNNENQEIYEKFISQYKLYTSIYHGIDRFFSYEISLTKFFNLDKNDYYHRNVSKENDIFEQSYYIRLHNPTVLYPKPGRVEVFFNRNIPICVFNGCHEDVFYQGMENFLL